MEHVSVLRKRDNEPAIGLFRQIKYFLEDIAKRSIRSLTKKLEEFDAFETQHCLLLLNHYHSHWLMAGAAFRLFVHMEGAMKPDKD